MLDPAVREAIRAKVGEREADPVALLGLDILTVNHAHGLTGIDACENLRILVLAGCELDSLNEVANLHGLGTLAASDSTIGSIEGLANLNVHTVLAERSELLDISPLLRCPGLVEVRLEGTALSKESYRRTIPELVRSGCDVSFPSVLEWELMTDMRESGLSFSYYESRNGYRLCRPGLKHTETPEVNHPVISPDELRRMLSFDPHGIRDLFSESI
ncbi:hypothetical protein ACFVT1_04025 [Streptomyces sp. NPDC057963]|uniref:hypothetical protein n=1 Tax=Streptomyces sp. NPDC057963 TaxID=3346290 RepID=UPI0036E39DB1